MAAVSVAEVVKALDAELNPGQFADGQHNGLQLKGKDSVERLATAVSCNQDTIEAAIAWGADALLTHHGMLWGGVERIDGIVYERLRTAMDAELNLLSYHLPLDAHVTMGNNAALAEAAGATEDRAPAFPHGGRDVGMVASLPEPHSFGAWVNGFERNLRSDCLVDTGPFQVWPFGPKQVRSIGFVSGAGAYDVAAAIDMGLDCFVTGEVRESVYHQCKEAGIHFVAGGHYLTERMGTRRVGSWVARLMGLEHRFIDVDTEA